MNNIKTKLQELVTKIVADSEKLRRYSLLSFVLLIGLIYGFLLFRINTLSGQQPSEVAISQQIKAAKIPQIDKAVVKQLESLQDNSVNVKTLFNQARSNPFQ